MKPIARLLKMDLPKGQSAFLWGARKTGKSTFLRAQFPNSLVFDFLQTDLFIEFSGSPFLLRQQVLAKDEAVLAQPIILDEVQKVPQILDEVHWLIENKGFSFILCGSLQIRDLNLQQTDLVYLSACESATGRLYRGEGIMSLQRSFLLAGSNSVIANLWRVEEQVTGDVTMSFFKLWSKGELGKSEALRQAQLATIKALKEDQLYEPHPYFWAAPVLTGMPN